MEDLSDVLEISIGAHSRYVQERGKMSHVDNRLDVEQLVDVEDLHKMEPGRLVRALPGCPTHHRRRSSSCLLRWNPGRYRNYVSHKFEWYNNLPFGDKVLSVATGFYRRRRGRSRW